MLTRLLAFVALASSFIPASFAQQGVAQGQGTAQGAGQIYVGPPTPPATVTIAPASQVLAVSTTQNFVATVVNDSFNQGVNWTLSGPGCSGATCGTLSATTSKSTVPITYTAPASAPSPNTVVLTATSILNPGGFANASITITSAPPPVVVGNICGTLQFQTPAGTNTFTCPPSNSSFIAFTIDVSTTDTPTGVQACLPLPPGAPGRCFNLIQACDPTNVCQGITTPGGITQIWYGIGLPVGITTLIVTNSPAAGGVLDVSAIDAQNIVAFGGAAFSSGNNTATTNPVGPAITATANSLTISTISSTGTATAVAAPFTFVPLSGGDGVAYQLNSTAGISTPNWTTTSGTWSGFTATFIGGTTKPVISVAMNPTAASVLVNTTLAVTPTVTNDTAGVNLALTGANCSGATCGTLSSSTTASGVSVTYTAPAAVPSPSAVVTLTASSITDPTKTATTTITVTSNPIVVTVSPGSATVQTSATHTFSCTVTNDAATAGCDWTLTGAGCSGATCGGISVSHTASGVTLTYTGPASVPSPATVSLTATSTTDATKSAVATITVVAAPAIVVSVSPGSANVQTSNTKTFSCTVVNDAGAAGCDWALTGAGCSGATCGTLSTSHTASGVTLTYTAPGSVPSPATVTLTATSTTDGTKSAAATITVVSAPVLTVVVAPGSASVQTGLTQSFTPTVTNDGGSAGVDWTLTGAGCSGATCGTISLTHTASGTPTVYTAPAVVPSPATVTIKATSTTDNTKSASSTITVFALPIVVSVSPGTATVPVNGTQAFTPTVTNDAANAGVDWTLGSCTTFTENFNEGTLPAIWAATNATGVEGGGSFSPSHVSLSQGVLQMNVTQDGTTAGSVGAEIELNRQFGYGTYSWSMQAAGTSATQGGSGSAVSGQISSTFQYSGGNPVPTEIDSPEIEGQFPNQIEWTTWLNGVRSDFHQTTLTNPQNTYHIYKYIWAPGSIAFYLDGSLIWTSTTNVPTGPAFPIANLWGTNSTSFGGLATAGVTRYMYINNFTYSNCGTLSATHTASGIATTYTAPPNAPSPATVTITATSTTDNTKSATSTITIGTAPNITIAVAPTTASVTTNGVQNFTATLTNDTSNQGATWALSGAGCSGATCGTLSKSGSASGVPITYTAPASVPSPATVTLTATSVTDPTKTATATITVTSPVVTVKVSPTSAIFQAGSGSQLFTASVANSGATPAWTLSCSVSNCGSVTPTSGFTTTYTPPASVASTITVTLTATVTGPVTGTATITVNPTTGPFSCVGAPCPAFAGAGSTAMGSGALSLGGRGGVVYNVNTISDATNAGCVPNGTATCSLRDCVQATGARTCIFTVSGNISLTGRMTVTNPYLTVAGQSAPGGGIWTTNPQCTDCFWWISTHDVVIRYIGCDGANPSIPSTVNTGTGCFLFQNANNYNDIIDHVSLRWWGNKAFIFGSNGGGSTHEVTMQWMLIYEPNFAHPVCVMFDDTDSQVLGNVNEDGHHNMLVNCDHRMPLFNNKSGRWVNNIVYDYGTSNYAFLSQGGTTTDIINNLYVGGNLGGNSFQPFMFNISQSTDSSGGMPGPASTFISGNVKRSDPTQTTGVASNQLSLTSVGSEGGEGTNTPPNPTPATPAPSGWFRGTQLATPQFPIVPDNAINLPNVMLATVGDSQNLDCSGNFQINRNSQDQRIINQYQTNGNGALFNYQYSSPTLLPGTPCTESLHDGIPDQWKTRYGLSTTSTTLYNSTDSSTGLTYLEDYLDGLTPAAIPITFAASCSQANVQSAVNTAPANGIVQIPGGSCTWSSTVTVAKGLTIQVAPGATVTLTSGTSTGPPFFTISNTGSNFVHITGNNGAGDCKTSGPTTGCGLVLVRQNDATFNSSAILMTGPVLAFRIDHVQGNKGDSFLYANNDATATGENHGVLDHNYFLNYGRVYFAQNQMSTDDTFGASCPGGSNGGTSWHNFLGHQMSYAGTGNLIYFEDNQFNWTASPAPSGQGAFYSQYGGMVVIRYNLLNGWSPYMIDEGDNPACGSVYYEVYNNTFTENCSLTGFGCEGKVFDFRSGNALIHDNAFVSSDIPATLISYPNGAGTHVAGHDPNNFYWWNNTWNSGSGAQACQSDSNPSGPVCVNVDGSSQAPVPTRVIGAASGCAGGACFYLRPPTTAGDVFFGYTPYTYPNPLITGGSSGPSTIPVSLFSMNNDAVLSVYPPFPIGGIRLWDPAVTGWAGSQTGPSTYNFTNLNARLSDAPSGYDIMWTAGCSPNFIASSPGSTTPCQSNPAASASLPSDVATGDATWKGFITALVNNSLAQSHHIKFYEMNNEADLTQYCFNGAGLGNNDCTTNAANVVTMVKDAYTIIHSLDPSALVVSPTGSTVCTNNCGVHFLPAFLAAGGAPYIDIVGMHAYMFNIPTPSAFSTVPEQITNFISQLRTLMSTYSLSALPLWFTEGSWGGGTNNTGMTDDQKVAYLARDYLLMRMGGVARFYWYAYSNTQWGTLFDGTSLTKAGTAMSLLDSWLVGSSDLPGNCTQDGSLTWQCSITRKGNPAIIIWNPTNTPAVTVSSTFNSYLTLDNTTVNPIVSHSITAGLKPVMVVP